MDDLAVDDDAGSGHNPVAGDGGIVGDFLDLNLQAVSAPIFGPGVFLNKVSEINVVVPLCGGLTVASRFTC